MPSDEFRQSRIQAGQTDIKLPVAIGGEHLPAIYPKSAQELAQNAQTAGDDQPRVCLLFTAETGATFSVGETPPTPFCPLPHNTLFAISVPAGEKVRVSAQTTVVWL